MGKISSILGWFFTLISLVLLVVFILVALFAVIAVAVLFVPPILLFYFLSVLCGNMLLPAILTQSNKHDPIMNPVGNA